MRVFKAKLEEMKTQLVEKSILGIVKAYTYVVEFQKRGLPHAHFLLIMNGKYKIACPEQYDRIISAELPDPLKYKELHTMIVKHMMHGPCGNLNRNFPCTMNRPSCKNGYPRSFNATTITGKDSYPIYRRHDDGRTATVRKCELDNRCGRSLQPLPPTDVQLPYKCGSMLKHKSCEVPIQIHIQGS